MMLWSRARNAYRHVVESHTKYTSSAQESHKKCVSRHNALVARLHNMCTSKMHTPDSAHVMHWCTALHVQCFSAHVLHMQSPYVLQDALLKTVHMWCTVVVSASWMCMSWLVHLECARPLALCTYKMHCCSRQCIKTGCLSEDVHMQQCIVDVHIHDAACTRLE